MVERVGESRRVVAIRGGAWWHAAASRVHSRWRAAAIRGLSRRVVAIRGESRWRAAAIRGRSRPFAAIRGRSLISDTRGLHTSLNTSLNHSCVSPKMGCLEYT